MCNFCPHCGDNLKSNQSDAPKKGAKRSVFGNPQTFDGQKWVSDDGKGGKTDKGTGGKPAPTAKKTAPPAAKPTSKDTTDSVMKDVQKSTDLSTLMTKDAKAEFKPDSKDPNLGELTFTKGGQSRTATVVKKDGEWGIWDDQDIDELDDWQGDDDEDWDD